MNKWRVLVKAFKTSIMIKGPVSFVISLLGFVAAFLPVVLADRFRALTDILQNIGITGNGAAAFHILLVLIALYFTQLLLNNLQQYINGLDEVKIHRYIQYTVMRHKCEVQYKYIENFDDFHKRIAFTSEYAGQQMARCIGNMITALQLLVGFVTAGFSLWQVSPYITIILFVTSVPAALLSYLQQDETFRYRSKWMTEGALAIHYFHMIGGGGHSLDGLQEIRHFGLFDYLKARWRSFADDYITKKNEVMTKHVKFNAVADFLRSVVYIVILIVTVWEIYRNPTIGLGTFTLVFSLSGRLQTVTGDFLVNIMVLVQNIPYIKEFFDLEELEREATSSCSDTSIRNGDISFDNVSFSYPNSNTTSIKGLSVKIREGEKIAIVGENGSGKSTFINLLCGVFAPQEGSIKIGSIPIDKALATVRKSISVVFQDFAHYESSLRDNITVSDKNRKMSDDEIMDLLRKINISEIVEQQPQGLNELVGSFSEKGNNLSGGQWQKISIARAAFRKDAKIMILDEPTSALDPVAEAQIYKNFSTLTGDKTTILISHRLGITAIVDRILVFKDGSIIEDGSHKQLMDKNGHYAKLYRAQSQWYA